MSAVQFLFLGKPYLGKIHVTSSWRMNLPIDLEFQLVSNISLLRNWTNALINLLGI